MTEISYAATTKVRVRDLPLLADIGIDADEIGRRQPLIVTVELVLNGQHVTTISDTVDYRHIVCEAEVLANVHIPLIETFAHRLAQRCMAWPPAVEVRVRIDKPYALARGLAGVEVSLGRACQNGLHPMRHYAEDHRIGGTTEVRKTA